MNTKPIDTAHLLYANGEDIDHNILASVVKKVPNYALGPFCWLVWLGVAEKERFREQIMVALPSGPQKYELLISPISDGLIFCDQGGFGLAAWMEKYRAMTN